MRQRPPGTPRRAEQRQVAHDPIGGLDQLGEAILLAQDDEQRHGAARHRQLGQRRPEVEGVIGTGLGLGEAPVERGLHRLPHRRVVAVQRMAGLLGEVGVARRAHLEAIAIAAFQLVHRRPRQGVEGEVATIDAIGQRERVARRGEPLVGVARPPQREVAGAQRVGHHRVVERSERHALAGCLLSDDLPGDRPNRSLAADLLLG